mmetsp:Transcript_96506/g.278538  ORF Transcript_96506/g.278538 Transcript_96506/m.278538 type:complete len:242 (-) Transcript_96506:385-1110(-)
MDDAEPLAPSRLGRRGAQRGSQMHYKTRQCKFFAREGCRYGEACQFAHGDADAAPAPDLYRTRLCTHYAISGGCSAGQECVFAHGTGELRGLQSARSVAQSSPTGEGPTRPRAQVRGVSGPAGYDDLSALPSSIICAELGGAPFISRREALGGSVEPTQTVDGSQGASSHDARYDGSVSPEGAAARGSGTACSAARLPGAAVGDRPQLETLGELAGMTMIVKNSFLEAREGTSPRRRSRSL